MVLPWVDLKIPISKTRLKITFWESHPDLPSHNELRIDSITVQWKGWHVLIGPWWCHQMDIFSNYWPFVRGIHRSPVNSPHKGQWRGALMFSFICTRINGWVNNQEAGDSRRYHAHYDVTVMYSVDSLRFDAPWYSAETKNDYHFTSYIINTHPLQCW